VGWFESAGAAKESNGIEHEEPGTGDVTDQEEFCLEYLKSDGKEIHWDFINAVLGSAANTAIVPLQDVLGLGTEARMNLPNTTEGNWTWRFRKQALTGEMARRLKALSASHGRT